MPSITGLPASGPILPRPSTAVPLVMTATRLARMVRSAALAGSASIAMQARGDAGRIGQREVALGGQGLGRLDFQLSRPGLAVILQRGSREVRGNGIGHEFLCLRQKKM